MKRSKSFIPMSLRQNSPFSVNRRILRDLKTLKESISTENPNAAHASTIKSVDRQLKPKQLRCSSICFGLVDIISVAENSDQLAELL